MKKTIFLGVLLLTSFAAAAQRTAKDVFLAMPSDLVPQLTENNKLDMVDFLASKMQARVTNSLDGHSELLSLGDSTFSLQVSEALRYDVRMLQANNDTILCLLATFGKESPESEIHFYTTHWKVLPTDRFIALPQTMFVARFVSEQLDDLQITCSQVLNPPATQEQKEADEKHKKELMIFKWNVERYIKS